VRLLSLAAIGNVLDRVVACRSEAFQEFMSPKVSFPVLSLV
jgi:lipoprotein signal peptidase